MEKSLQQIATEYTGQLSDYRPFEKSFRNIVPDALVKLIAEDATLYGSMPYPHIAATDYMCLVRTGNRALFEEKYFTRRHKLTSLVAAAYCDVSIPEMSKENVLDEIVNGIWAICEETSWCLPAHNTYVRDTPQIILPDSSKPVMDLFACESGATLSMTYYLLKDKLDEISPLICERIYNEVHKRIIMPYVNSHFWWMGNGDEPMCNWTVWCIQNSLLCAFLLPYDKSERRIIFDRAAYGIDCFLKDYGEDGCCDEGAQYYRHAGLCLFGCLDILNAVSGNAFNSLFDNSKIKNIAEYIVNVHIGGEYYVNYSDCSPLAGSCGCREYLFGKSCNLPRLTSLAACDFAQSIDNGTLFEDESVKLNLYYRMQTILFSDEILSFSCAKGANSPSGADIYYESVGVCVLRNDTFTVAAKAGDNNDSHNHNDTGSIILYKGTDPIFIDIGPETYSQKTFSPQRYEIWTMQSAYHNLPVINGFDQMAGSDYRATDVNVCIDKKTISMNIATAYPLSAVSDSIPEYRYTREIAMSKIDNTVILSDTSSCAPDLLPKGIVLNFITCHKPVIAENNGEICIGIGSANVSVSGASNPACETLPITDARLKKSWSHDLYRISLSMRSEEFVMTVK